MRVYTSPKKVCSLWLSQLTWLYEFWMNGESTVMISKNVSLLKQSSLRKKKNDGGYWFGKFVNNHMQMED